MTHTQNLSPRNTFARFMEDSAMLASFAARLARNSESRGGRMPVLLGSKKATAGTNSNENPATTGASNTKCKTEWK